MTARHGLEDTLGKGSCTKVHELQRWGRPCRSYSFERRTQICHLAHIVSELSYELI
jgi:hypothetical protein